MARSKRRVGRRTARKRQKIEFEQFLSLLRLDPSFRKAVADDPAMAFASRGFSITRRQVTALEELNWVNLSEVFRSFSGEPSNGLIS